jgi:hypothetical protein
VNFNRKICRSNQFTLSKHFAGLSVSGRKINILLQNCIGTR